MNAFEDIYREHYEGIFRFLYKMTLRVSLSEELTQETFYRAWCSMSRYNGQCDIFTWLAAIAKNVYFTYVRKNRKYVLDDRPLLLEEDEQQPDGTLLQKERTQAVRLAISHLPKKHRDVVVLRTYAELKYSQIAAYLGISEESAKVLYFRAKHRLKEELCHVCL